MAAVRTSSVVSSAGFAPPYSAVASIV